MANPLLNKMSKQIVGQKMNNNPLMAMFNMMKNGANSPQMLIDMISRQKPQVGQQMKEVLSSGRNPQEIVQEMIKGRSPMEVENMKNALENLGLPRDVSARVFGNSSNRR